MTHASNTVPAHDPVPAERTQLLLPDRIAVVADLHLGEGGAPETGAPSLEHFLHDREFETWLDRITRRALRRDLRVELVLAGDVFDFLRVVRLPRTAAERSEWRSLLEEAGVRCPPGELRRAAEGRYTRWERRYGFGVDEPHSVWKLWVVARGHGPVIRTLARFCRAGGSVIVLPGNHDPEWAWPGVQRAFRVLLERAGAGPLDSRRLRVRRRVHRRANLHIEHGHAIHWFACADRDLVRGPPRRLRLPCGYLVSRYWLNVLERAVGGGPHRPGSVHLKDTARRRPWRLLVPGIIGAVLAIPRIGVTGWRLWFGRLLRWWPARVGAALGLAVLALPEIVPALGGVLPFQSAAARAAAASLAFGLPQLGLAAHHLAGQVTGGAGALFARRYARRVGLQWRRPAPTLPRYVVLGHTHQAEICEWTEAPLRVVYLNPGGGFADGAHGPHGAALRFVWLVRRGQAYARHYLLRVPLQELTEWRAAGPAGPAAARDTPCGTSGLP